MKKNDARSYCLDDMLAAIVVACGWDELAKLSVGEVVEELRRMLEPRWTPSAADIRPIYETAREFAAYLNLYESRMGRSRRSYHTVSVSKLTEDLQMVMTVIEWHGRQPQSTAM